MTITLIHIEGKVLGTLLNSEEKEKSRNEKQAQRTGA